MRISFRGFFYQYCSNCNLYQYHLLFVIILSSHVVVKGYDECNKPQRLEDEKILKEKYPLLLKYIHKNSNYSGSVVMLNYQDHTLKLTCDDGEVAKRINDKDGYPIWRMWSYDIDNEEKQFNNDGYSGNEIKISSPDGQGYYRDYACFKRDVNHTKANPHGCNQYFNVFTRPLPWPTFSVKVYEGQEVNFECKVNDDVLKRNAKRENKYPDPIVNHPYIIKWILPQDLKIEQDAIADNKLTANTTAKPRDKKEIEEIMGNDTIEVTEEFGIKDQNDSITKSKIRIKAGNKEKHDGIWECVVIDGNGLTSRLSKEFHGREMPKDRRFKGYVSIHIRKVTWPLIGLGIVGGVLVLVGLTIIALPDNITEYDKKANAKEAKEAKLKMADSGSVPPSGRKSRKVKDSSKLSSTKKGQKAGNNQGPEATGAVEAV